MTPCPRDASFVVLDLRETWWVTLDTASVRGPAKDPYYRTKGRFWPCAVDVEKKILFTHLDSHCSSPDPSYYYMLAIGEKLIRIDFDIVQASIPAIGAAKEFRVPDIRNLVNEAWKVMYPSHQPIAWVRTVGDVARENAENARKE
jgi:hypothetical protein